MRSRTITSTNRLHNGCVRLVGAIAQRFAALTLVCDEEGINHGFDGGCGFTRQLGSRLSVWHSGQIQNYLRAIGDGDLALALVGHFGNAAVWLVFAGIFVGLAVKVPLVPFHTR